ncbi:MAG: hypothetical protein V4642_16595 [Bacteroidota bacterium]
MKRTLYIFLFIFLLTSGICTAQNSWKRLIDAPAFSFAVNPYNPNSIIVGGLGRRLYFSTDAGKTWRKDSIEFTTASAQFTNVFIHPLDTNIVIVGGSNFGSIRRSTDYGKTWKVVLEPELGGLVLNGESMTTAPHNPEHIYFARLNPPILYRSTDRGATWDSVSSIPKANPDDSTELDPSFCTIAFRRDSSNIMLAGCASGRIYKSLDTGKTWKLIDQIAKSTYGDAEVPKIAFSTANPLIGYAVVAYFFPVSIPNGGVHKTIDGGNTWKPLAFADTSLWALGVPLFGSPDEVSIGGFSQPFSPDNRVPGVSVVGILKNDSTWERYDNSVPWSSKGDHNVWLLKYAGNSPQTQKLYMASEAGFFVKDAIVTGIYEENSFKTNSYSARYSHSTLSLQFPDILKHPAPFTIVNLLGQTVFKGTVASGTHGAEFQLPHELPAGIYVVYFLNEKLGAQSIIID